MAHIMNLIYIHILCILIYIYKEKPQKQAEMRHKQACTAQNICWWPCMCAKVPAIKLLYHVVSIVPGTPSCHNLWSSRNVKNQHIFAAAIQQEEAGLRKHGLSKTRAAALHGFLFCPLGSPAPSHPSPPHPRVTAAICTWAIRNYLATVYTCARHFSCCAACRCQTQNLKF